MCETANVDLSPDQITTLEDFKEIVIWLGRYPAPNKEEDWDRYHDVHFPKTIIREMTSKGGATIRTTRVNPATFANWENYKRIWDACFAKIDPALKP